MTAGRSSSAGRGTGGGLALAVASAATFGSSGTFATALLRAGWSPGAAVITRVLVACAALTPLAVPILGRHLRAGGGREARRAVPVVLVYGLLAVAGCQLCYFEAVRRLDVGTALLIEYSGTLLVVGWTWARHGQRPLPATAAGAAAAVAGLCLVLRLGGAAHLDPAGVLWGVGAAVGLAAYFVISARADGAFPPLVVAWGGLGAGGLALLVVAAAGLLPMHAATRPVTLGHATVAWWVPVLGLAVVAAAFAYSAGIAAARRLGARLSSFVGLAEVLFAVAVAWVLLGQRLSHTQLVGAALVVAGIALVRAGERPGRDAGLSGRRDVASESPSASSCASSCACACGAS